MILILMVCQKKFVLKCTHDSGGLVVCRDKNKLDFDVVRKKLETSLENNYYIYGREWPYKNVKLELLLNNFLMMDMEVGCLIQVLLL